MMNIGWVIACTWRTRPDDLAVAACVIGALHAVGALIGRFCSCVWGYRGVVLVGLFVELDSCDGEEGVMRTGWLPGSAAARCGYGAEPPRTITNHFVYRLSRTFHLHASRDTLRTHPPELKELKNPQTYM